MTISTYVAPRAYMGEGGVRWSQLFPVTVYTACLKKPEYAHKTNDIRNQGVGGTKVHVYLPY